MKGIDFRNAIVIATVAVGLMSACGSLDRVQQTIVDAADDNAPHVNTEFAYAGFGLRWRDEHGESVTDDSDDSSKFRSAFGKRFGEELDRRAPKALQGDRPAKVLVIVSDVYKPGALARGLAFQDPSVRIEAIVQDASDEQHLHTHEIKIVDDLPLDFSGGIQFRVGTIPDRLARKAVNEVMDWLRSL